MRKTTWIFGLLAAGMLARAWRGPRAGSRPARRRVLPSTPRSVGTGLPGQTTDDPPITPGLPDFFRGA